MLSMKSVAIGPHDTTAQLHDVLAALGARMIVDTLHNMAAGPLTATPQPQAGVTYAAKIGKEEAKLDFNLSAVALDRKIRAFNSFPGAQALVDGVTIKLWAAELVDIRTAAAPGQLLSANAVDGIVVACGDGALRLTTLQKPGGKRLPAAEFLKSFALEGKLLS
jgi:methionyl-tRNA formyltransferase